jgi:hypothetical protein
MLLRKEEKKYFYFSLVLVSIFREALIGSLFYKVSSQKVVFNGGNFNGGESNCIYACNGPYSK